MITIYPNTFVSNFGTKRVFLKRKTKESIFFVFRLIPFSTDKKVLEKVSGEPRLAILRYS